MVKKRVRVVIPMDEIIEDCIKELDLKKEEPKKERDIDREFGRTLRLCRFIEGTSNFMEPHEVLACCHSILNRWCEEHDEDSIEMAEMLLEGIKDLSGRGVSEEVERAM